MPYVGGGEYQGGILRPVEVASTRAAEPRLVEVASARAAEPR